MRARAAEVEKGGEDILIDAGERGGGLGGLFTGGRGEFIAEFEHHALGGFFADSGDADERGDFAFANGEDEIGGCNAGKNLDGEGGTDTGDSDELFEEGLFVSGEEAVEREGVFAHVSMDAEADFGAGIGEVGEGGDGDGDVVADAAGFDDGLVGVLFNQRAAEKGDHILQSSTFRRGAAAVWGCGSGIAATLLLGQA